MSRVTRRWLLSGATGLVAVLAGCGGLGGSSSESRTVTAGEGRGIRDRDNATTDPERLQVRMDTDQPPVWFANGGSRPTIRDDQRHFDSLVIDSTSRADRIRVADGMDRDSIDSFLAATDFQTETIYIQTIRLEECFQLELCGISWQAQKVSTEYTRLSRPYTEQCAVDKHVFEVFLIRIPDTLDADRVSSHSSSIGTGSCQNGSRGQAEAERKTKADAEAGTETDGDGDGDSESESGSERGGGGEN